MDFIQLAIVALLTLLSSKIVTFIQGRNRKNEEQQKKEREESLQKELNRRTEESKKHEMRKTETGEVMCSCGVICVTEHIYKLHIEHRGEAIPPLDPTGWPERQFQTVPNADKCQRGVVAKGDLENGIFTAISLCKNFNDKEVRDAISKFQNLLSEVSSIDSSARLCGLIAVNSDTWRRWDTRPPPQLKVFEPIYSMDNKKCVFPSTPGQELFVFAKSQRFDLCYELSKRFILNLGNNVSDVDHQSAFRYMGQPMGARDLTGFMDGTRNPDHLLRAIADEVFIFPDDCPSDKLKHTGGTYMYAGKYVHDLEKFRSLEKKEKSQVIGRDYDVVKPHKGYDTRPENPRLEDAEESSHVKRSHGSMQRQAMPYITAKEEGLYFICFSRFLSELDTALKRMAGHFSKDHSLDNVFKITKSITNGYYYVPSLPELDELPSVTVIPEEKRKEIEHEQLQGNTIIHKGKKKLEIFFEFCSNCGYMSIYLEKKKVLENALKGTEADAKYDIVIVPNPDMPRLSSFEISIASDGHILWSKLSQPDGRNNRPNVFPTNVHLIRELRKYVGIPEDKINDGVSPKEEETPKFTTRVGVW